MLTGAFIYSLLQGIFGDSYEACLNKIRQQYVTATAIGSMVGEYEMIIKNIDLIIRSSLNLVFNRYAII